MQYDKEALGRVKIGHFLKRGILIRGVIHVGANDGYEIDWYLKLGIRHILAIEPEREAFAQLWKKFQGVLDVQLYNGALGNNERYDILQVPPGNTGGSTFLNELPHGPAVTRVTYKYYSWQQVYVVKFDWIASLLPINVDDYNCLVVDVQGMELQVLKGFGPHLEKMDCLNIECSEVPLYDGEAPASEVVAWLGERGFDAITPIEPHNDILFVRKGVEEVLSG